MAHRFLILGLLTIVHLSLMGGFIGYIYPAGGRAGTTCEVLIGGTRFNGIKSVIVDGDMACKDIEIESVEMVPAMRVFQYKEQRTFVTNWVNAVFAGKPSPAMPPEAATWDTKKPFWQKIDKLTPMEMDLVLAGLYDKYDPLQASPSLNQRAILRLKIAPNAKQGRREIRFIGSNKAPMLCNPVPFYISATEEFVQSHRVPPKFAKSIPEITVPCAVNGQITPGETDTYHFKAKKGDVLSFKLLGRSLLPFIGDGVPGHFQATLQICDSKNKEIAYQDDNYFDPDPVLNFTSPADDTYTLVVRDALFRGREDFVYRIHVSKEASQYKLLPRPVWELPWQQFKDDGNVQQISIPSAIEGTLMPKQSHQYAFTLKKDETAVVEVWARRSLSPLDSILRLYDATGKMLTSNDDFARPKIGAVYHHADSYLRFTAPMDGVYTVVLNDATGAGGKDYRYWLRIDHPRPDYRVWTIPSGLEVPAANGTAIMGFVIERIDGHRGDITIDVTDTKTFAFAGSHVIPDGPRSPNSFESVCGVQVSFPDCTRNFLTLKSLRTPKERFGTLKLQAKCGTAVHEIRPADESMQAFAYNHLIESKELRTAQTWRNSGKFTWAPGTGSYFTLCAGNEILLKVAKNETELTGDSSAELHEPPMGFSLVECKETADALWLRLKADSRMPPRRFNQIVKINFVKKGKRQVFLPTILIDVQSAK